jgi:predicted nuclease of predicted toxin-antitoxin system
LALKLYADECVDSRVVAGLRRRGADVITAGERSLLGASDERQMEEAITLARVLVTADQDFLAVAAEMARRGQPFPGVLFIKERTPVGDAVRSIADAADLFDPSDMAGGVEWIP